MFLTRRPGVWDMYFLVHDYSTKYFIWCQINCILYMVVMHKNYQVPDRIGRGGNACPGRPVISKKMKHETSFLPFLWAFPEAHFYENFPKYFLNEKDKRQKTADKAAMTIKKQM